MSLNRVNYITHEPSYFNQTIHGKLRRIALSQEGKVVGVHHQIIQIYGKMVQL